MGEALAPTTNHIPSEEKDKVVLRNGVGRRNKEFRNSFKKLEITKRLKEPKVQVNNVNGGGDDDEDDDDGGFRSAAAKRPNSMCVGVAALNSSTNTTPRRSASCYISSGISCMTPTSTSSQNVIRNGTLPRRPTSLYSNSTQKIVPNFSFPSTPIAPKQTCLSTKPIQSSGYQTWNHNQNSMRRPASFCGSPGNSYTWTSNVKNGSRRPLSVGPAVLNTPSDAGYRSLPSSVSDYLLSSSQSSKPSKTEYLSSLQHRRLSLPSAQAQLRTKASPTLHGLSFRPFTCGLSPNGTPIFLGCTHLHSSPSPSKPRAMTPTTSQAIQQLLLHSRNGFRSPDDKMALFFEILDSQERFAKVKEFYCFEGEL